MTFRINEAPQMVLDALCREKVSRGCGIFWSILCCPFTLGATICPCSDKNSGCCYPNPIDLPTEGSLTSFIDILKNKIRLQDPAKYMKEHNLQPHEVIEWQVTQTLQMLATIVEKDLLEWSSYKDALKEVYRKIFYRAKTESRLAKVFDEGDSLLGREEERVNHYGMDDLSTVKTLIKPKKNSQEEEDDLGDDIKDKKHPNYRAVKR